MSIATRIQSMYENVGEVYDTITNVTLPEHKNIENIPRTIRDSYLEIINNGINVIYDNWEKVVGEGTSLSLTPTEEAPMDIVYKGNTYQKTTNNLMNLNVVGPSGTQYNIKEPTITNGVVNVQGKNDTSYNSKGRYQNGYVTIGTTQKWVENKTYYLSFKLQIVSNPKNLTTDYFVVGLFGGRFENIIYNSNTGRYEGSITTTSSISDSDKEKTIIEFRVDGMELNISEISLKETEDYTFNGYGISPTPDIPSPIQVVSGDNSIEVCGKNLASDNFNDYYLNGSYLMYKFNKGTNNCATSISDKDTSVDISGCYLGVSTEDSSGIVWLVQNGNVSRTQWNDSMGSLLRPYLIIYPNNQTTFDKLFSRFNIMSENGTSFSTYEPYTGASYPINLPVENLLNGNSIEYNSTNFSVTFENEIVSVTHLTSSTTGTPKFNLGILPKGTYCISQSGTFNAVSLNRDNVYSTMLRNSGDTFEANGTEEISIVLSNDTKTYSQIMLEKGTKANHYTPYGTTPIELCKIGNYQDKFIRNSGKNLLEPSSFAQKVIDTPYSSANVSTYDSETGELSIKMGNGSVVFDNFKENTQYTIILKYNIATNGSNLQISYTDNTTQNITPTAGSGIFRLVTTEDKSVASIKHSAYDSTTPRTLYLKESGIFEGVIETTDFEPYGNGDLYVKKEIGKVVFDENTNVNRSTTNENYTAFYIEDSSVKTNSNLLSNYFTQTTIENMTNARTLGIAVHKTLARIYFTLETSVAYDKTTCKTWLGTHNTEVYYVLETPTYTLIEDTTLLNQLEAIKMSYEGQTNISQTNNDLAFILNPTALEKV